MTRDQADSLRNQHRTMRKSPGSKGLHSARKIAVTSGKGGVGKSNVSLNMAIAFGRLGKRVLLVDADTNLANIDILLGIHVQNTLADVIVGSAFFSDTLIDGPEGIQIMPGSSGAVEMLDKDDVVRDRILAAFDDLEQRYDIVLIDTGAGLSESIMQFVVSADDVILVTNPEPTAITDAYAMLKVASYRNTTMNAHVLINLAPKPQEAKETFNKLQLAVRNFLQFDINYLGALPIDPNIPQAVAERTPFILRNPRSSASTAMVMMAHKLLKMPVKNEADRASFISRIFRQRVEE
ncbi:MinD/ParA family protein [bacterium]|nr:MinD/ParA family protein [bacterium]